MSNNILDFGNSKNTFLFYFSYLGLFKILIICNSNHRPKQQTIFLSNLIFSDIPFENSEMPVDKVSKQTISFLSQKIRFV